ncbi:biopolymer transporter ExbD [Oscillatoria sp. CS-180]|uniref:ExbD/TolR family protein n=1 Tax=Oscillatoria sp. CS-180 TaxID=3021720 RepID=UPI00232B24C6|nr:biopolymer transporter ExbD [Oscillatoria sp. CS-180]MDB9529352.1 biopolymer transporter ExbD [Oscillatoria sp. CS-180]
MLVKDNDTDDDLEVNILPLIDVIFAILAFFILSSLYLTQSEGLPVNLPDADSAQPQDQTDFTVTMQPDGAIFLEQQPVALENLRATIEESLSPEQTAIITIKADEEVYHGEVVAVMDELRTLEGAKLGIATEPSQP